MEGAVLGIISTDVESWELRLAENGNSKNSDSELILIIPQKVLDYQTLVHGLLDTQDPCEL